VRTIIFCGATSRLLADPWCGRLLSNVVAGRIIPLPRCGCRLLYGRPMDDIVKHLPASTAGDYFEQHTMSTYVNRATNVLIMCLFVGYTLISVSVKFTLVLFYQCDLDVCAIIYYYGTYI
jgi:hypothetical protein